LAPLRTEWRKLAASIGENNPNWVVFPGEIFCRSFESHSFPQQLQTSEQNGSRRCQKLF